MHSGKIKLVPFIVLSVLLFFQKPIIAENQIDSYFRYIPSRSVDAQSGKVEISEADTEYSYEFKAFDKLPIKLSLDNKYIGIENTTTVKLPAHLVGLTTDIETTLPLFMVQESIKHFPIPLRKLLKVIAEGDFLDVDKTYLCLGMSPSFYGDDWSFRTSGFRLPSRTYLIYQPTEKWTFLAGVAFYPDFENEVLPILGFIYKPNDKLTFEIVPKRPNISYILNDKTTLFAEGGSTFSEFEVSKDNLKNVVLRYKETHLGCGIKYKFNKFIESSISAGGVFGRSLKYRDDSLGEVDIKNGVYTELRLEIKI